MRRKLWYKVIDSEVLHLFRTNRTEEAHQKTAAIVGNRIVSDALEK
jgi:hypothetical protein